VSSGTDANPAPDGSSSLCWYWLLLIIYTCELDHPSACKAPAEAEAGAGALALLGLRGRGMKRRIIQPWTPSDDERLRKLAAEGR
jgi:hypothetical protein